MAKARATGFSSKNTAKALHTDKYELTMLDAFIEAGIQDRKAVFELFARKLPDGRKYGVVAGTQRAIEAIFNYRFTNTELEYLGDFLSPDTIEYLAKYSFTGTVTGYKEGDYWFPYSPLLTIQATLGEAVILETLLLSIFNYDCAVASAASHLRSLTNKPLMEFGARRVNEDAAVVASRASYLAGFTATSNLEAGKRYNVPVFGTAAHAFTLAFQDEKKAFEAQIRTFGTETTLLVDTYDIEQGVANALEVAGTALAAVRIDSGDPFEVLPAVRKQLDDAGATNTKIVLSGDVNYRTVKIIEEAGLPVDSYGVGTSIVTGDGYPAAGFVYKLVSIENEQGQWVDVAKTASGGKKSVGGRKTVYREYNENWEVETEHFLTDGSQVNVYGDWDRVQEVFISKGKLVNLPTLEDARTRHLDLLKNVKVSDTVKSNVNDDTVWQYTPGE